MGAQRTMREAWRRHIVGLLDQALERNDAAIDGVAAAITTTILAGQHVYAFGAGHSLMRSPVEVVTRPQFTTWLAGLNPKAAPPIGVPPAFSCEQGEPGAPAGCPKSSSGNGD